MKSRKGFTLIELMVVVLIVGILAAVAIPLMRGRIDSAKWSEAKSAMGTIATALRAYASEKGTVIATDVGASDFPKIGIELSDLDGTYFTNAAYTMSGVTATNGVLNATILCTAANSTRATKPTAPATMTLTIASGVATFSSSAD
jgi:prepilin-type N-terminal cleavage/methylation domain-containing protein